MNAIRERIDFSPHMTDTTRGTLTVRIDPALKQQLEAFAAEVHFELDDLVDQMIREMLFRNSPEFADPTHPRTIAYRAVEESLLQGIRGELISEEELDKFLDDNYGTADEGSPRRPRDQFSNPTSLPPGTSVPDTDGSSSTGSC
jgi:hypothetical protein